MNAHVDYNKRIYAIIFMVVVIVSALSVVGLTVTEKALSVYKEEEGYDFLKDIKQSAYNDMSASPDAVKGGIVFFGDSITELCNVYAYYSGLGAVYNRGIVADYTARMKYRVDGNVNALEPSKVVLLIGTNDLGRGVPIDEIAANISDIIDMLYETEGVKIILQAVYPVNYEVSPKTVGRRGNADIKKLNEKLETLAVQKNCIFADCTDLLADRNGNLKREYTTDGLHLKKPAYLKIAARIRPLLS